MSLLEVSNLKVHFHGTPAGHYAVGGVSFFMEEGDMLALVGESGTGKTVTAMCISGLLPRQKADSSGSIRLSSHEIFDCEERELCSALGREMTVVFQNPMTSFDPLRRIGSQVEEALAVHCKDLRKAERRARSLDMLRRVGLADAEGVSRKYPHEMSGGMLQRAMIASAIVTRPNLLIADEITTSLDVTVQSQIVELIRGLNREYGMAVLFISHDISVVRRLCDDVIVMQNGKIVERGRTEQVFTHPRHEYTRRLMEAVPTRDRRLRGRAR